MTLLFAVKDANANAVKERVKHCALNLVNVEVGVPVHH